jgi:hypothetical protein
MPMQAAIRSVCRLTKIWNHLPTSPAGDGRQVAGNWIISRAHLHPEPIGKECHRECHHHHGSETRGRQRGYRRPPPALAEA